MKNAQEANHDLKLIVVCSERFKNDGVNIEEIQKCPEMLIELLKKTFRTFDI